jgi:hypothetical protein
LSGALARLGQIEKEVAALREKLGSGNVESENALAEMIEKASERLEAIAARITSP